ncbi:MAG: hypothetical protein QW735_03055 [archaeon]
MTVRRAVINDFEAVYNILAKAKGKEVPFPIYLIHESPYFIVHESIEGVDGFLLARPIDNILKIDHFYYLNEKAGKELFSQALKDFGDQFKFIIYLQENDSRTDFLKKNKFELKDVLFESGEKIYLYAYAGERKIKKIKRKKKTTKKFSKYLEKNLKKLDSLSV